MADDATANRELVAAILATQDVMLDTVCDGQQALEAARGGGYDLILMDVQMPVMDGMQATRAIRALPGAAGRVPIVALTANVQVEQVARCLEAGMDAHLGKPIHVAELLMTVCAALKGQLMTSRAA
jgi:CheY-like chemotaxis protein